MFTRLALHTFSAAILLAASIPSQAGAQVNGSLTFGGDIQSNGALNGGSFTGAVGPYRADLAFGSTLTLANAVIWCVDWAHFAPATGTTDSYTLSALTGNLSATRKNDVQAYLRAAWLFEQVTNYTATTGRSGRPSLAPIAAGRPNPMVPRPPEVKKDRQESTGK